MKCPHCAESFFDEPERRAIGTDAGGFWNIVITPCPACKKFILQLESQALLPGYKIDLPVLSPPTEHFRFDSANLQMVRPKVSARAPCPPQVPDDIKKDYEKAALVLADSPEASAALSRRCLQHVLDDKGFKSKNLIDQINLVLKNGKLPTQIAENIDAIRNIGNFGAHPQKSLVAAELLPVEPEEAEWNLDVLESLFDVFYVQPDMAKQKRDALNQKLKSAGKPPMK
jgi:hypothetical protein